MLKKRMKHLQVNYNGNLKDQMDIDTVSLLMDNLDRTRLDEISWPSFPYQPDVSFSIAHNDSQLFLKYYVSEKSTQVVYREINDTVHKDSCVEIFIGIRGEKDYYNYEFNCLGVCSAGFGDGRFDRKAVPAEIIRQVKIKTTLQSISVQDSSSIYWELALIFPIEAFHYHRFSSLSGKKFRGNLYKCGDDLPDVHFLSWNRVISDQPDFHQPDSFGEIDFE
jgi:hypothetical protein